MAEVCPCGCRRKIKGLHLRGAAAGYRRAGAVSAAFAALLARAEQVPGLVDDDGRLANRFAIEHGKTIQLELIQHLHGALTRESFNMLDINKELVQYEARWQRVAAGR
jgi:hypothetical protein